MTTTELAGKTFVVTGANTGIGRATVEALAQRGASRIVLAARSLERTQSVIDALRSVGSDSDIVFVPLDLADLSSVRRAAERILELDCAIDALINNAGIAGLRGQTTDGFELTFGTNHLGHFLLTEELLPLVRRASQGRIVIVSSRGHYRARRGIDWDALTEPTRSFSAMPEYFVSKLANVLHAKALARRLAGSTVTTYSLHPGGVASDIYERRLGVFAILVRPFLITNEEGARTQLRCATDPDLAGESGLYYTDERPKTPSPFALDERLQDELFERSQEWVRSR
jgi:dehydrogenase/reductase SDR family protein 13